jgi:putative lysine transport system permease protein
MNSSDISYLLSHYWSNFLYGTLSTVILSIVGTFGGLLLGIFLAFAERVVIKKELKWYQKGWRYALKGLANFYSVLIRGTPMMVQAMIFKYGCQALGVNWNAIAPGIQIFDGWFYAGLIVITFNTAAYMGEIVKAGLNGIDKGQLEGASALGLSPFQTLFLVSLPQALRNAIPTIGNEWVVNIKDSSVLNVIGVTELYFMSGQAANKNYMFMASYLIIALIYLLLTLITTLILKLSERKMDGKKFSIPFFHYRAKKEASV